MNRQELPDSRGRTSDLPNRLFASMKQPASKRVPAPGILFAVHKRYAFEVKRSSADRGGVDWINWIDSIEDMDGIEM